MRCAQARVPSLSLSLTFAPSLSQAVPASVEPLRLDPLNDLPPDRMSLVAHELSKLLRENDFNHELASELRLATSCDKLALLGLCHQQLPFPYERVSGTPQVPDPTRRPASFFCPKTCKYTRMYQAEWQRGGAEEQAARAKRGGAQAYGL